MVLGKLNIQIQKNEISAFLIIHRNQFIVDQGSMKPKTLKVSEKT